MIKKREKSCGAVVFTRLGAAIRYVILCEAEGIWGFPKGHMEAGEMEEETALREIFEETGLRVRLIPGFRQTEAYPLIREGRPDTVKQVVYFLAEYEDQPLRRQESEIAAIRLTDYDGAMRAFQYENQRQLLREAHRFLTGAQKRD